MVYWFINFFSLQCSSIAIWEGVLQSHWSLLWLIRHQGYNWIIDLVHIDWHTTLHWDEMKDVSENKSYEYKSCEGAIVFNFNQMSVNIIVASAHHWWHCLDTNPRSALSFEWGTHSLHYCLECSIADHSFQRIFSSSCIESLSSDTIYGGFCWRQFDKCHRPQISDNTNISPGLILWRRHCLDCLIPNQLPTVCSLACMRRRLSPNVIVISSAHSRSRSRSRSRRYLLSSHSALSHIKLVTLLTNSYQTGQSATKQPKVIQDFGWFSSQVPRPLLEPYRQFSKKDYNRVPCSNFEHLQSLHMTHVTLHTVSTVFIFSYPSCKLCTFPW